ncbi:MAG: TIGR04283 family arsenosugar biosynthesis glycosyltransferase [Candidatus Omnitrophota bacterium]|nr:TIGR04283 family arsenosugar biosynthesis glycosyltransferase [Candidatus Omnitrophota bacterium]MDZ4241786.1 TIGR04283 family arsenosugar biosynthesis glycosyltransferase [Candidatus Omnitrophota bacterium]
MLDIIVPVYNEEKVLLGRSQYFSRLGRECSLIFVDGESTDRTVDVAAGYGRVIRSRRGRGAQKNVGAEAALADHLFFLHVDTDVSLETLRKVRQAFDGGAEAGCLTMRIDRRGAAFSFFEWLVNVRAKRLGIIDGDLGMFLTRDVWRRAGGFDPVPIMEDIFFSRKLRRIAKPVVLEDFILVSARRWSEEGFWRTLLRYGQTYWNSGRNPVSFGIR